VINYIYHFSRREYERASYGQGYSWLVQFPKIIPFHESYPTTPGKVSTD